MDGIDHSFEKDVINYHCKGILQGDTFSLILFVLSVNSL